MKTDIQGNKEKRVTERERGKKREAKPRRDRDNGGRRDSFEQHDNYNTL